MREGLATRGSSRVAAALVGLSLLVPVCAAAFSSGPPADRVGLCNARLTCKSSGCHDDFPLDSGTAVSTLALETGPRPQTYRPSELIRFVLSVVDPDSSRVRVGFEIAAVAGCPFPAQAGTLAVVEAVRTQIAIQAGLGYLEHGCAPPFDIPSCGYVTWPVAGSNAWIFDWQAPPAGTGPVTFFWAINSADGSGSPLGDYVSLGQATLDPACPGRVADLKAVKAACDPSAPGVPRVELAYVPPAWSTGSRIYRVTDEADLADPASAGAPVLPTPCDDPPVVPLTLYTVVGLCEDGSQGPL